MKPTFLFILMLIASYQLDAQLGRFDIGVEYSLAFSRVTEPPIRAFSTRGFHSSSNIFIKGGYNVIKGLDITAGAGYLTTKQFQRLPFGVYEGTDLTEIYSSYQYFVFPAGVRYRLGSFFINPEIALAVQDKHLVELTNYSITANGTQITTTEFESFQLSNNPLTVPLFLSLGTEFDLGQVSILFGLKSYYSLTSITRTPLRPAHYYGFGVMTGVRF